MIDFVSTFIVFFAVIDPIGTVPVFLAVTKGMDGRARTRIAFLAAAIATGILVFFVVAGELLLTAMGIPLSAFQIAGGIILFLFALNMIFGDSKPEAEVALVEKQEHTAVFPLAMPSIASPGAILAAVLLTDNSRVSIWEQAQVTLTMLVVLLVALVLMLGAGRLHRLIGTAGASVISRVMGMLLAAVAMTNALAGVQTYFDL